MKRLTVLIGVIAALLLSSVAVNAQFTTNSCFIQSVRTVNVRQQPSINALIVAKMPPGLPVGVIAQNTFGNWYQISTGDWVAAWVVNASGFACNALPVNNAFDVVNPPVIQPPVPGLVPVDPNPTCLLTVNRQINVRQLPSIDTPVIAYAMPGAFYAVTAQSVTSNWYQVAGGGWIFGGVASVTGSACGNLPINDVFGVSN